MPEIEDLIVAIRGLQKAKNCWCDFAIDHPLYKGHSDACKRMQSALEKCERELAKSNA